MSHSLSPCPSCSRHVRAQDAACPFCQAILDVEGRASTRPASQARVGRLGRAAMVAVGATLASASLGACGSDEPSQEDRTIVTSDETQSGTGGEEPVDTGSGVGAPVAPPEDDDGGAVHAMYGAAPAPD